ncbi:hypothetical protein B5807_02116 [Epicoccum nigrum]|uniref:Uncharacterized protein n=1 Tax=Epicoccum nigrum TaxID=105696 RepID=A0A1Y2M8A5_EPING|nr:hypothetical protein B5807_02116 [Epicoccum nigrum]
MSRKQLWLVLIGYNLLIIPAQSITTGWARWGTATPPISCRPWTDGAVWETTTGRLSRNDTMPRCNCKPHHLWDFSTATLPLLQQNLLRPSDLIPTCCTHNPTVISPLLQPPFHPRQANPISLQTHISTAHPSYREMCLPRSRALS